MQGNVLIDLNRLWDEEAGVEANEQQWRMEESTPVVFESAPQPTLYAAYSNDDLFEGDSSSSQSVDDLMDWMLEDDDDDDDVSNREGTDLNENLEDLATIHFGAVQKEHGLGQEQRQAENQLIGVDPELHISRHFFTFDGESYRMMIQDIRGLQKPDLLMLKKVGIHDIKRWNKMKDGLAINGGGRLHLKTIGNAFIAAKEEWEAIVKESHLDLKGCHLSPRQTINNLKATWCTNGRKHGIPVSYIKHVLKCCEFCQPKCTSTVEEVTVNSMPCRLGAPKVDLQSTIVTDRSHVQDVLASIMIKHKVRLVRLRTSKKSKSGVTKTGELYVCHRSGSSKRIGENKRRLRRTKKCCCPFRVRVQYIDALDDVHIHLHAKHEGHVPTSRSDLYYLPVHPRVIQCCMDDLFDVGTCRHVAKMSSSKERFHMQQASEVERATYRFFMISKEIQQLSYSLRRQGAVSNNDWSAMYMEALKLQAQEKVLYVQPYNPNAAEDAQKPFIVIIQDKWMLEICLRFSPHNAWAVDSTFKTNMYGLPLYAAVLPNQVGVGMPVWLMMCTNDVGTSHESIALELTIRMVFARMGCVRPSAIVIDKCPQELNAITSAISDDTHCWALDHEGNRVQVACHVLLCWFHSKKAWVENLLPQVPKPMRDHVYSSLCNLMHSSTEAQFDANFQLLLSNYSGHPNIQRYVSNGWCSKSCTWRHRWPKFGRLFSHGNVDTTNLVERLWQYVKYTLLDATINRSMLDLIHAMVGDSRSGSWMGGTLLEFFKCKQELADSGRFSIYGSSKAATSALSGGEKILERYTVDRSTLQVVNESTLLFKILSMTKNVWYHVSMQSSYCDCPDWSSQCKHLYGARLILKKYFPIMSLVLPIVDNVHAMAAESNSILPTQPGREVNEQQAAFQDQLGDYDGPTSSTTIGIDQEIYSCIDSFKKLLQHVEESLPSKASSEKKATLQQLMISLENLKCIQQPSEVNLPKKGSIAQIQVNVTQTRLGHNKRVNIKEKMEDGSSQHAKRPCVTGVLRRKHQRGRNHVRFPKWQRLYCPHCCSKTLVIDPLCTLVCNTCHALLPLSNKNASTSNEGLLLARKVRLWIDNQPSNATIVAIGFGLSPEGERHFTIAHDDGGEQEQVHASLVRITLV